MSTSRKKAIVVCPGRGSYNKSELGYLYRYHADKKAFIQQLDDYRQQHDQPDISELDQAPIYDPRILTRGDNASSLIFACAYADFMSIDTQRYDIIAVTGNSMGWYIALACARGLDVSNAIQLIDSMGKLMHEQATGGQVIYPMVDDNWQAVPQRAEMLADIHEDINQQDDCELYNSIFLGGMRVIAGNDKALDALMNALPAEQHYPMRLPNHAAFHSPLMQPIAEIARRQLPPELFQAADISLVDGRGGIWSPPSSNPRALWDYTLGQQITSSYDFSRAIQVCVREFAPDCLIIPGPGNALGGVTAQALIEIEWQGIKSKQDFIQRQQEQPFLLSMGLDAQRAQVVT